MIPVPAPVFEASQSETSSAEWAEVLRVLAWLHAAERNAHSLAALRDAGFPATLTAPEPHAGFDSLRARFAAAMDEAIDGRPSADDLAADYAAIYLTHAYRVSPCESVWRDEDHLTLQQPTFAVRAFYRRHGLAVHDWRLMADDHLSLEIEFVATLLERNEGAEARHFLERHLLQWLPGFAAAVDARASTAFFRLLARLTAVYSESLHEALRPFDAAHEPGRVGTMP